MRIPFKKNSQLADNWWQLPATRGNQMPWETAPRWSNREHGKCFRKGSVPGFLGSCTVSQPDNSTQLSLLSEFEVFLGQWCLCPAELSSNPWMPSRCLQSNLTAVRAWIYPKDKYRTPQNNNKAAPLHGSPSDMDRSLHAESLSVSSCSSW